MRTIKRLKTSDQPMFHKNFLKEIFQLLYRTWLIVLFAGITGILVFTAPEDDSFWRAGLGVSEPLSADQWANKLGAGWYLDWRALPRHALRSPQYWMMIRTFPDRNIPDLNSAAEIARTHPGNVWIIGNEPDNPYQDSLSPEEYAWRYEQFYSALKQADPTCLVAIAGVTQPSELRMRYLERVLSTYQKRRGVPMPVDIWTVHGYVLREEKGNWGANIPVGMEEITQGLLIEPQEHGNLTLFQRQIVAFRTWMKLQGYQDTPLVITEMGILLPEEFGYTPDVVADYLTETFIWLDTAMDSEIGYQADEGRLVQRWAWFSLADRTFPVSNLLDPSSGELTPAGKAFQTFTRSHSR